MEKDRRNKEKGNRRGACEVQKPGTEQSEKRKAELKRRRKAAASPKERRTKAAEAKRTKRAKSADSTLQKAGPGECKGAVEASAAVQGAADAARSFQEQLDEPHHPLPEDGGQGETGPTGRGETAGEEEAAPVGNFGGEPEAHGDRGGSSAAGAG